MIAEAARLFDKLSVACNAWSVCFGVPKFRHSPLHSTAQE